MTHEQFCREVLGQEPYFVNPTLKYYKKLSISGKLIVSYEKKTDGTWYETTQVERAKIEVITAKQELDKSRNEAMLEEYMRMGKMTTENKGV